MRGFPLLNTLLILAGFALAWWPLKHSATGSGASVASVPNTATAEMRETSPQPKTSPATFRVFASTPLASLRIESLGQLLFQDTAMQAEGTIERELPALEIPDEGVEFWVEATFVGSPEHHQPIALGIELAPNEKDSRTVTLWTDESDSLSVADSAVFTWAP